MTASWPRSTDREIYQASIKVEPGDFVVRERLSFQPAGQGEHLLVHLQKTNLTTEEVAGCLADHFAVEKVAVGYAGMKDKRAVASQWFSVHLPDESRVITCQNDFPDAVLVLDSTRHSRKLRRGEIQANGFEIKLHLGNPAHLKAAAGEVERTGNSGVPNYFGSQRFGWDNLEQASRWLPQRRRKRLSRFKQGLYLSVLRGFLFNEVLAARVCAGNWSECLPGDVVENGLPTAPLWGRGRSGTCGEAAGYEQAALAGHQSICEGLEHAGLTQQRRSLMLRPDGLQCRQADGGAGLVVSFELPAGAYATSFLGEVFHLDTPAADT